MSENDPRQDARKLGDTMVRTWSEGGHTFLARLIATKVLERFETSETVSIDDIISDLEADIEASDPRVAEFNRPALERLRELRALHRADEEK